MRRDTEGTNYRYLCSQLSSKRYYEYHYQLPGIIKDYIDTDLVPGLICSPNRLFNTGN